MGSGEKWLSTVGWEMEEHQDEMHRDAPDQFHFKPQFMGGYLIQSDQQFKSAAHTSHQQWHFSHDPMSI